MKLTISDKPTPFKFSVDSKSLEAAIGRTTSVLQASSSGTDKFFGIHSSGTQIYVFAHTPDTFAIQMVSGTDQVQGTGTFGFDPQMLLGIIKGRPAMGFSFTGASIEFRILKGKYSGTLVTAPVTADCMTRVNSLCARPKAKLGSTTVDQTLLDQIREGLAHTSVKDIYAGTSLLSYLMLDAKSVTVFSFDNHHFAYFKAKAKSASKVNVAAPSSTFSLIERMFEGSSAELTISPEQIRLEGASFVMVVPTVQVNEKDFTLIPEYIRDIKDYSYKCEFSNTKFLALTNNMLTLHSSNATIALQSSKDGRNLGVTFQTQNGSAADALPVKTLSGSGFSCKIDPRILRDSFSLITGYDAEPVMGLANGKLLTARATLKSGASLMVVNSISS